MAFSKRHQFIDQIDDRLSEITVANGFNTNAGAAVSLGFAPEMGSDDPDGAIAVLFDQDELDAIGGPGVTYELPVDIQVLVKLGIEDVDQPWMLVEQMLQDVKRAFELEDRQFNGVLWQPIERGNTSTLPRQPGSLFVGASVTYLARLKEAWGAP